MSHNPTYYCFLNMSSQSHFWHLQVSDRLYNPHSSRQTQSKTKSQSYLPEFLDWTDILDLKADVWPRRLAGAGGSPPHAGQHVRNNRALPGLGEREGMWQRDSLRDPCGWIWLLSLEMLSTEAGTPSGCYEPGHQTILTCATWLSLLLPARGSHGQFAMFGRDRKQRWH